MEISVTTKGSIAVMNLEGHLDTNSSPDAQKRRVLLGAAQELQKAGGELRVCSPNEEVMDIFEMSGFDEILNVYAAEDEAMQGF
jgi:anti-anti-sigma regulatory factor